MAERNQKALAAKRRKRLKRAFDFGDMFRRSIHSTADGALGEPFIRVIRDIRGSKCGTLDRELLLGGGEEKETADDTDGRG